MNLIFTNSKKLFGTNFKSKILFILPSFIIMISSIIFSQLFRYLNGYKIFYQLFLVPVLVFLILYFMTSLIQKDIELVPDFFYFSTIIISIIISIRIIAVIWGSGYLTPLFEAQYISGHAHHDTIFHSAITNMFLYFNKPSIGVEGLPILKYHYFSHFFLSRVCSLLGLRALEVYHLFYPVLVFPLFFGLYNLLVIQVNRLFSNTTSINKLLFISNTVFLWGITGLLPVKFRNSLASWDSIFLSESYAFALLFAFVFTIFLLFFMEKRYGFLINFVLIIISTIIITFSKISVGTIWTAALFFIWVQDYKNYKKFLFSAISGVLWLFSVYFIYYSASSGGGFYLFHFVRNYVRNPFKPVFYLHHYFFTLSVLFLIFFKKDRLSLRKLKFPIILITVVTVLPGLLLPIGGGSAYYFSNVNEWYGLPLFAVLFYYFCEDNEIFRKYTFRYLIFISVTIFSINSFLSFSKAIKINTGYTKNFDNKSQWNFLSNLHQSTEYPLAIKLDNVKPYGIKGNEHISTWIIPILSPAALSGVPVINDIDKFLVNFSSKEMGYGFDDLMNRDPDFQSKKFKIIYFP